MGGRRFEWALRAGRIAVLLGGAGVLLFYANRLFTELPLYAGDEGAYLIRALYASELARDPASYPLVQPVGNTVYFALVRLVDALSLNVVPWLRLTGALAYFSGLALLFMIAVKEAGRRAGLGVLAIAAAFPYYRFVVTAMPEGLYVGLLSLLVLVLYSTYCPRPRLGAAMIGALAGALVLVKPHGLVVVPAFVLLIVIETLVRRASPAFAVARMAIFAAAFFATGCLIELADGKPLARAARFFLGGDYYAGHLAAAAAPDAFANAALAAVGMTALCAIFVSTPLMAAAGRALADRRTGATRFGPGEAAFLFVALCLAGTLAMVTIFAFKMATLESETKRLWGRYFEFYAPMLWLLAAGPLSRWEAAARGRGRLLAAAAVLAGLAGLFAVLALGVRLFPWDGSAMTAFAAPDAERFPFGYLGGARLLAALATLGAAVAIAVGQPARRVWPVCFVALGLLSTRADDAWVGEIANRRTRIEHELHVASALTASVRPTVVLAPGPNEGHVAYLRLDGRAHVRFTPPGENQLGLARFASAIVIGDRSLNLQWRKIYAGEELSVYVKELR